MRTVRLSAFNAILTAARLVHTAHKLNIASSDDRLTQKSSLDQRQLACAGEADILDGRADDGTGPINTPSL